MAQENYGFNIDLGLNSEGLQEGLKKVNKELNDEKANLYEVAQATRQAPNNIDAWKKKQSQLTKTIKASEDKIKILVKQLKLANKEYDGSKEAKKHIEALKKEIDKTTKSVKDMSKELSDANKKIKELQNVNFDKMQEAGSALSKAVTGPIIAAMTSLVVATNKTAFSLDAIVDTSSQVGANAQQYQSLGYAIQILGGNSDSLYRALIKVNDMLGDIATGDSLGAAQALSKIGLSIEDIKGLSSDQAFLKIKDALSKLGSEAEIVAAANELFGERIGASLLPMLKAENSEIDRLVKEAESLGTATDEQIKISGEYTDSIDRMKYALQGVSYQLMEVFAPAMTNIANIITDRLTPALKNIIKRFDSLSPKTKKIIVAVTGVVASIGPVLLIISKLGKAIIGLQAALPVVSKLVSVMGALGPIGAVIASVVAVLIYAYKTNDKVRASINNIMSVLGNLIKRIVEIASSLIQSLMPIIEKIMNVLVNLVATILPIILNLLETLMPVIEEILNIVADLLIQLMPVIELLIDSLVPVLENLIKIVAELLEAIIPIITMLLDSLIPVIKVIIEIISKLLQAIMPIIQVLLDSLMPIIDLILETLEELIPILEPIINLVGTIFVARLEILTTILSTLFDVLMPIIEVLTDILKPIIEFISKVIQGLVGLIKQLVELLKGGLGNSIQYVIGLFEKVRDIVKGLIDKIKEFFGQFGNIKDIAGGVIQNVGNAMQTAGNWVGDRFNDLGNWFGGLFGGRQTNNTNNNNVNVYTTSSTIDFNSINTALGGGLGI